MDPVVILLATALAVSSSCILVRSASGFIPQAAPGGFRSAFRLISLFPLALLAVITVIFIFPPLALVFLLLGTVSLFLLLKLATCRRRRDRDRTIRLEFPTLLDALVLNVESGHALFPAFLESRRIMAEDSPLSRELVAMQKDIELGKPQLEALEALACRISQPGVDASLGAVILALRLGTPVARVLREQADKLRRLQVIEGERYANTLSIRLLLPLFFFVFPASFLLILSPVIVALARSAG